MAKLERTTIYEGAVDERVQVMVTPEQKFTLAEIAEEAGVRGVSTFMRQVALGEIQHPNAAHPSQAGTDSMRLKFLAKAPCGPWQEAIDLAESFTLSPQVADELEAKETDVIVRAVGSSMEGARIHEGDLILMRLLTNGKNPRRNEITFVQVERKDGTYESMIKHWIPGEPLPTLHDGNGKAVSLGENIVEVKAVAVAQGLIARF